MAKAKKTEEKKCLSPKQLLTIERGRFEIEKKNQELEIANLHSQISHLRKINAEHQVKLLSYEISEKIKEVNNKREVATQHLEQQSKLMKEIAKELSIDGRWGYEPLTGEIQTQQEVNR
jgi:hypothetical protein